ncbi:hypothetical protein [Silicimonas algicola]|uniref:hypothetical protein n=1 Tax=Silicimonas algicola TaxID=1826607 RepID=UPI0013DFF3AD|nr:hypothetical protein [Silicimonas algicola]
MDWHLEHRIRAMMVDRRIVLSCVVELDEICAAAGAGKLGSEQAGVPVTTQR